MCIYTHFHLFYWFFIKLYILLCSPPWLSPHPFNLPQGPHARNLLKTLKSQNSIPNLKPVLLVIGVFSCFCLGGLRPVTVCLLCSLQDLFHPLPSVKTDPWAPSLHFGYHHRYPGCYGGGWHRKRDVLIDLEEYRAGMFGCLVGELQIPVRSLEVASLSFSLGTGFLPALHQPPQSALIGDLMQPCQSRVAACFRNSLLSQEHSHVTLVYYRCWVKIVLFFLFNYLVGHQVHRSFSWRCF